MPEPITEKAFQQQVLELAQLYGWRAYHTFDSRRSVPGFPDLVLVRPPRLVFAELKTQTGRVSAAQQEWLDDLTMIRDCMALRATAPDMPEVYVWRPDDLQRVAEMLAGERAGAATVRAVTPLSPRRGGRAA